MGFGVIADGKGSFHALFVDYTPWRPDDELDAAVAETFKVQPPIDQLSDTLPRQPKETSAAASRSIS